MDALPGIGRPGDKCEVTSLRRVEHGSLTAHAEYIRSRGPKQQNLHGTIPTWFSLRPRGSVRRGVS